MLGTLVMVRAPLTETVDPKVRLPDPPLPLPLPLPLLPLQLEQPIAVCQVLAQVGHLVAHAEQRAQPRLRLSHLVPPLLQLCLGPTKHGQHRRQRLGHLLPPLLRALPPDRSVLRPQAAHLVRVRARARARVRARASG